MTETAKKGSARRGRIPGWALAAAILTFLAAAIALALPRVDEALYAMTYYGDYDLTYTVDNPKLRAASGMQCSSFLCRNEKGEPLFCRNLDYTLTNHPIVMVTTAAPGKNAGLGLCDLYYLGYSADKLPTGSIFSDRALLSAPRITMDGVNEYGVALAILTVPHAEPTLDAGKESIDEASAVRLVLDHAKTVREAVDVIGAYNIAFHEDAGHFMIADGSGDSAVLEFVDGKIVTVQNDDPWQVVTNFILSSETREGVGQARYDKAEAVLREAGGILSEEKAMELLKSVSQPGTLWSVIYNLRTGETRLALKMNYDKLFSFKLDMRSEP
ncbi:MAG TPA: linear amide C-N hydrolase [Clostridia bacterium]|nr:linear amide C-N hydrolase [Clostridia bacterium]